LSFSVAFEDREPTYRTGQAAPSFSTQPSWLVMVPRIHSRFRSSTVGMLYGRQNAVGSMKWARLSFGSFDASLSWSPQP